MDHACIGNRRARCASLLYATVSYIHFPHVFTTCILDSALPLFDQREYVMMMMMARPRNPFFSYAMMKLVVYSPFRSLYTPSSILLPPVFHILFTFSHLLTYKLKEKSSQGPEQQDIYSN